MSNPPRGVRAALRSVRRNVRKHGLIFVPYRLGVLIRDGLSAAWRPPAPEPTPPCPVPCRRILAADLHSEEVVSAVRAWSPDLGLSLGAPILRPALFQLPKYGTLNLHLGKVPNFRGAPPAFWELYTGASEIGVTVHWIDDRLDTGAIAAQATAPIYPTDTLTDVTSRATELGRAVLHKVLTDLASGTATAQPQLAGGHTYRFPTLRQRATLALRLAARRWRPTTATLRTWIKRLAAIALLGAYRPIRDLVRSTLGTHPVRVFTFHRITTLCRDGMTVRPMIFRQQAAYLARSHRVVSMVDAIDMIRRNAPLRRPVAVLTFDDAYESVWEAAAPELQRLGLVGCCFASTNVVSTTRRLAHDAASPVRDHLETMEWPQLMALSAEGWTIGAHSATHARLSQCTRDELAYQLDAPLRSLRDVLAQDEVPFAYPVGGEGDAPNGLSRLARKTGYAACFSNFGGDNRTGTDLWSLRRIDLGGDHDDLAWRAAAHGLALSGFRVAVHSGLRIFRHRAHAA
ncbi:MAG: formyltransferase family protein [Gemmatimonadales bacterium]